VEEGRPGARRVRRLLDDPGRFLAVSQLGLTVIGFFASAYAAVSLVRGFADVLERIGIDPNTSETIGLIVVTIVLALFTIIFAELVPKTLALANAERFALTLSLPVDFLARALGPLIRFLTGITAWISRLFGADVSSEAQITAEELRLIVERGGEQGVLEAEEEQMINSIIELGERRLHEVMIPRIAIVSLPADATLEEAIDKVVDEGHSRIPVYEESIDEVVGILYAKDLLPILKSTSGPRPALKSLLRPPVFVPESMTIDDLLHEFQRRKVHIAIILDEYGGTAGLVTIEDLLEEIVGEIQDEYDTEEPMIVRLSEDEARVDGRADVDDLAELFDTELGLEDEDEYDTVGGLVYHRIGGVPSPGDVVEVDGLSLTVESTDGRRVGKVLVVRRPREDGELRPDEDGDR
jgi:putative hemolysin